MVHAHGLEPTPELVRWVSFTREAGHQAGKYLVDMTDRPTAVVTANNFLAFGLLDAAREAGLLG